MATGYRGANLQPVQSGYYDSPFPGYAGQIATTGDPALIDGFPVEETDGIPVGFGVVKGTDIDITAGDFAAQSAPYTVKLPETDSVLADFVGIAVRDNAMPSNASGTPVWANDLMGSIMRKGRIFVSAPVAISQGDPVYMYVDDSDAHGLPIGSFTNAAAVTTTDTVQITQARWYKSAAANTPAIIELGY